MAKTAISTVSDVTSQWMKSLDTTGLLVTTVSIAFTLTVLPDNIIRSIKPKTAADNGIIAFRDVAACSISIAPVVQLDTHRRVSLCS